MPKRDRAYCTGSQFLFLVTSRAPLLPKHSFHPLGYPLLAERISSGASSLLAPTTLNPRAWPSAALQSPLESPKMALSPKMAVGPTMLGMPMKQASLITVRSYSTVVCEEELVTVTDMARRS